MELVSTVLQPKYCHKQVSTSVKLMRPLKPNALKLVKGAGLVGRVEGI